MKIIVLSQYYWPEPLPKAQELAEGLQARGHEVTVLTGFPNYPTGVLYDGYRIRPWHRETIGSVRVVRLAVFPDHSKSSARRIMNYGSFAVSAAILGPAVTDGADAMFVFHPPLTIGTAAFVLSRLKRMPFVYAVGDLWPEAIVASGMISNPRIVSALEALERFVYRHATAVAVVTPAMVDHLAAQGVPREKLHVIPDWADERNYRPLPPDPALSARLGMTARFNVVFAGQVGIVQRLDTVIESAELLRHRPEIQFVIVGDGVERDRLARDAERRQLANVKFVSRVASAEMPSIYALADVLLVHLSAQPIFRLSMPAKLYAYLACEKPILMAVDGYAADFVRSAKIGLTCPPEDPQGLADTVLQFASLSPRERKEMGRRARETFLHHYSRSTVLSQCEALLHNVAARHRR